jgi:hypothetical protein
MSDVDLFHSQLPGALSQLQAHPTGATRPLLARACAQTRALVHDLVLRLDYLHLCATTTMPVTAPLR